MLSFKEVLKPCVEGTLVEAKIASISDFAEQQNLKIYDYTNNAGIVRELKLPWLPQLEDSTLDHYLRLYQDAREKGISNNCFDIANHARKSHPSIGCIYTDSGAINFTGYNNHWINFQIFRDGTIAGFDLTAQPNILHGLSIFNVLAFYVTRMDCLQSCLNTLYGGKWEVMPLE